MTIQPVTHVPVARSRAAWRWAAASVFAVALAAVSTLPAASDTRDDSFHWTGRLARGKELEIKGINGSIRAEFVPGDQIRVDAVKHAHKSQIEDVTIEVIEHEGGVTLCAHYPAPFGKPENECKPGAAGRSNTRNNDVVVDFTPVPLGSEILLESGTRRLMKVVVDRDAPDPSRVPVKLRDPLAVPPDLPTRTFVVENPRGAWTVNGQAFDLERPQARVKRGTQEIWVIRNQSQDRRHPIEFRSGPFRVLSQREELLPGDELRLLATFGNATGRFVLPCANAVHADQGLMIGWEVGR